MAQYKALNFGPLAVAAIERTIGLELDEGDVWLSKAAHGHIARDHPADYPAILGLIRTAINDPDYIGQKPNHAGNYYLVCRTRVGGALVALGIEQNEHGNHNIKSAYSISQAKIDSYRQSGHLHITK